MSGYTKVNLVDDVEDSALRFGYAPNMQARFARTPLELQNAGVSLFRLAPGFRVPFGHRHREQEEVYVVLSGSARCKLGDEVVQLRAWDALRVAPEVERGVEAGPDGVELLAFGAPSNENRDAEMVPDFWPR
jgi:mannose-6-phosphate isomerase-like protein (cupin superfamily)